MKTKLATLILVLALLISQNAHALRPMASEERESASSGREVIGLINPGMELHRLKFSEGSLFMGLLPGDLLNALLKGYFYNFAAEETGDVSYLSHEIFDAYTVGTFWKADTAILVFKSGVFNSRIQRGRAGVKKPQNGSDRYPFVVEGILPEEIDYVFVSRGTYDRYEALLKDEAATGMDALLREKLVGCKSSGFYDKFVTVEPNEAEMREAERQRDHPILTLYNALCRLLRERNISRAEYIDQDESEWVLVRSALDKLWDKRSGADLTLSHI